LDVLEEDRVVGHGVADRCGQAGAFREQIRGVRQQLAPPEGEVTRIPIVVRCPESLAHHRYPGHVDGRSPGAALKDHRTNLLWFDMSEPAIQLLIKCGAESIDHPGGNLLSHLKRVSALLEGWGARPALRAAGLGHAFYGTDGFPTALLALEHRDDVREVLGQEAEGIVYLYAACDRKFTYPDLADAEGLFRDRFTGRTHLPDAQQRRDFVELTVANELDLLIVNPEIRARYGEALDRLFTRCRGQLSDRAWLAVRKVMR
jgi:hypothetical protein